MTKNKAVFPNDGALKKTLYLTTRDITEKDPCLTGIGERLTDSSSSNSVTEHPSPEKPHIGLQSNDREPLTEEQFEVVLEMLFGFYNEREIEKIYQQNIVFGSNDAIINEEKIKGKIE